MRVGIALFLTEESITRSSAHLLKLTRVECSLIIQKAGGIGKGEFFALGKGVCP